MTSTALMNTYGDRAATLVKGQGAWLWDEKGSKYLDALSGIAVCGLGHAHPAVTQAITEQSNTLTHCSNFFTIPNQEILAERLCKISGMRKVFFGNSGAEANEAAIKMARLFGHQQGIALPTVLVMENAFHGRTLATLRVFCDQNNWLLMLDEVQTGNGRTGRYFCFQHSDILPDVVTTSKGLGNGFPIGACLAAGKATELMQPGNHGSTFGGNPLACAAALATINTLDTEGLLNRASAIGTRIIAGLEKGLTSATHVVDIRGMGCMIGIELNQPCKSLFAAAIEKGLLINVTADSVIRLLPPFILTDEEVDLLITILVPLIRDFKSD